MTTTRETQPCPRFCKCDNCRRYAELLDAMREIGRAAPAAHPQPVAVSGEWVMVPRAKLERALTRARIFDDGSDGADGESAHSVVEILSAILAEPAQAAEGGKDVHTEHCCARHGCKYDNDDCPVALGLKPQSYPCEMCEDEPSPESAAPAVSDEAVEVALRAFDPATFELYFGRLDRNRMRAALEAAFPALTAQVASLVAENEQLKWSLNLEQLRADQILKDRRAAANRVAFSAQEMAKEIAGQLAASEADAARYRFLRDNESSELHVADLGRHVVYQGVECDEAVDAARAATTVQL